MAKSKLDYGPDNCELSTGPNGEVVIRFDPEADLGNSKTGKSRIVATTNGNRPFGVAGSDRQIRIGLKVFALKPKSAEERNADTE